MATHHATEAGQTWRQERGRGRTINPERKSLIEEAMKDGWPIQEVIRTYGISYTTIRRHVPEYPRVTKEEQGELGQMARRFNALLRKKGLHR